MFLCNWLKGINEYGFTTERVKTFWNKITPSSIVWPILLAQEYRVDLQVILGSAQRDSSYVPVLFLFFSGFHFFTPICKATGESPITFTAYTGPNCAPGPNWTPGAASRCSQFSNSSWTRTGPGHMKRPGEKGEGGCLSNSMPQFWLGPTWKYLLRLDKRCLIRFCYSFLLITRSWKSVQGPK